MMCSQVMGTYMSTWSGGSDPLAVHGFVYKLECKVTGRVYVGSTWQRDLTRRMRMHECHYRSYQRGRFGWSSSYEILEGGSYYIKLLEECLCHSSEELKTRERFWYDYHRSLSCVGGELVNRRRPIRWRYEAVRQRRDACSRYHKRRAKGPRPVYPLYWTCSVCKQRMFRTSRPRHLKSKRHYNNLMGVC